jgi:hypothetical protein
MESDLLAAASARRKAFRSCFWVRYKIGRVGCDANSWQFAGILDDPRSVRLAAGKYLKPSSPRSV